MVLRDSSAVTCEVFSVTPVMADGCMASTFTGFESSGFLPVRTDKPS
jgi:hypothetical protein